MVRSVRRTLHPLIGALGLASLACTTTALPVPAQVDTGLDPRADTFAFANQLLWRYDFAPGSGALHAAPPRGAAREPRDFAHRCALMVRTVRQFYYGARFDPTRPRPSDAEVAELLDRVLATDRRRRTPVEDPVVIPGFANLHEFSLAYRDELKRRSGGGWRTWLQRGNWRMVYPFGPEQQRRTAERLLGSLAAGHPPIVHVMNFPDVDVNHMMLLYRGESDAREIRFYAYDPNEPGSSTLLRYDREQAAFVMPPTGYYRGGPVKTYEIYRGVLY